MEKKYAGLRRKAYEQYALILEKLNHFNFTNNILTIVLKKLATHDISIRRICTTALFSLMNSRNPNLLGLKYQALKELAKQLKGRPHELFEPNIIEAMTLHKIIVNEQAVLDVNEHSTKMENLKKEIKILKKKGKFKEAKDQNRQLLREMNETNASGVDLGRSTKLNEEIIKCCLEVYFNFLKNRPTSPLLRDIFIGLPSFCTHVNIEIVYDLVTNLREYVADELDRKGLLLPNLISALLCTFQIITLSAGNAFNDVEEKEFVNALYRVINLLFTHSHEVEPTDFLALFKTLHISIIQRKQYSITMVRAFIKRIMVVILHLDIPIQAGALLFVKQVINRYPALRDLTDESELDPLADCFNALDGQLVSNPHMLSILNELKELK